MRTELFDYILPEELIATRPPAERDGGRLCAVDEDGIRHQKVSDLLDEIEPDDLLVLNETRVRRARLFVHRPRTPEGGGGARVELLFLHPLADRKWAALGKANRPLRVGDRLEAEEVSFEIVERGSDGTLVIEVQGDLEVALQEQGMMPIPPYMNREADEQDVERYQTVFARELGSAAAPTAGLHLTQDALTRLAERGVRRGCVILHVGIGTFRPVMVDDLDEHPMHSESIEVGPELVAEIEATRERGGRVIAVGTTVVRALESARDESREGYARATSGQTNLLIQPGYEFGVVDALLTNFHQPRSTLLALVSALAGRERVFAAYQEALQERYRFLSYGDAMWIPHAWASKKMRGEK